MEIDNSGQSTNRIEYNAIFTKTCQGGGQRISSSKWLTPNIQDPSSCPVRLFKTLMQRRGKNITTDRLYLTQNPAWQKTTSSGWFKNMPIGQNQMAKWTKESAEKVGLNIKKIKITNHSMRSTAVTQLIKPGVGEQEAIKITGHSSANSIKPYLQLDEHHNSHLREEERNSNLLSKKPENESSLPFPKNSFKPENESSLTSPGTSFKNCTFYNCNFK